MESLLPSLGIAIHNRRKRARFRSQKTIATAAGIGRSYLSQIEDGKRPNVALETWERIALALGVSLSELVKEAEMERAEAAARAKAK